MSNSIDERTVKMSFDDSSFQSGAESSISTLDKLKEALKFDDIGDGVFDKLKSAFTGLESTAEESSSKLSTIFSSLWDEIATGFERQIGSKIADWATNLVEKVTVAPLSSGWEKYEEEVQSVQRILTNTDYTIEEVEAEIETLAWYADETSYGLTDMTGALTTFVSAGLELDSSVDMIMSIANWCATSGVNARTASGAFDMLSKSISAGYISLRYWNSLSKVYHMGTAKFYDMVYQAAEAEGIMQKTADGMYQVLNKSTGKWSDEYSSMSALFTGTLKDQWFTTDLLATVLEQYGSATTAVREYIEEQEELGRTLRASEAMEELGLDADSFAVRAFYAAQQAKTWSDTVAAWEDVVSTAWKNVFQALFGNYEEAAEFWTFVCDEVGSFFWDLPYALADIASEWHNMDTAIEGITRYEQFIAGIEDMILGLEALRDMALEAFDEVFQFDGLTAFSTITSSFWALMSNFYHSVTDNAKVIAKLKNGFKGLANAAKIVVDVFSNILSIMGLLKLGIGEVTDAYGYTHTTLFASWEGRIQIILELFSQLGTALTKIGGIFEENDTIAKMFEPAKEAAEAFESVITRLYVAVARLLGIDVTTGFFDNFDSALGLADSNVFDVLVQGAEDLAEAVNNLPSLDEWVNSKFGSLAEWLGLDKTSIANSDTSLGSYIRETVDGMNELGATSKHVLDTGIMDGYLKSIYSDSGKSASEFWADFFNVDTAGWSQSDLNTLVDQGLELYDAYCKGTLENNPDGKKYASLFNEALYGEMQKQSGKSGSEAESMWDSLWSNTYEHLDYDQYAEDLSWTDLLSLWFDNIINTLPSVTELFDAFWTSLQNAMSLDFGNSVFEDIKTWLADIFDLEPNGGLGDILESLFDFDGSSLVSGAESLGTAIGTFLDAVDNLAGAGWDTLTTVVSVAKAAWDGFAEWWNNDLCGDDGAPFGLKLPTFGGDAEDVNIADYINDFAEIIADIGTATGEFTSSFAAAFSGDTSSIDFSDMDGFTKFVSQIGEVMGTLMNVLTPVISFIVDFITNSLDSITSVINGTGGVDTAFTFIQDLINSALDLFEGLYERISSFFRKVDDVDPDDFEDKVEDYSEIVASVSGFVGDMTGSNKYAKSSGLSSKKHALDSTASDIETVTASATGIAAAITPFISGFGDVTASLVSEILGSAADIISAAFAALGTIAGAIQDSGVMKVAASVIMLYEIVTISQKIKLLIAALQKGIKSIVNISTAFDTAAAALKQMGIAMKIKAYAVLIAAIAAAIGLFAAACVVMSQLEPDDFWRGYSYMIAIAALVAAIAGVCYLLYKAFMEQKIAAKAATQAATQAATKTFTAADSFKTLTNTLSTSLIDLGKSLAKVYQMKTMASTMLKVAAAILLILAGAMAVGYAIMKYPDLGDALIKGGRIMLVIAVALLAVVGVIEYLANSMSLGGGIGMMAIANIITSMVVGALAIVAAAMGLIVVMDMFDITVGRLIGVTAIIAGTALVLAGIAAGFMAICKVLDNKGWITSITSAATALATIVVVVAAFGAVAAILVAAVGAISLTNISTGEFFAIAITITGVVAGLVSIGGALSLLCSKFGSFAGIAQAALIITMMCSSLLIVAASLTLLGLVDWDGMNLGKVLIAVGILAVIFAALTALSLIPGVNVAMELAAGVMVAMASSLLIAAAAIYVFAAAFKMLDSVTGENLPELFENIGEACGNLANHFGDVVVAAIEIATVIALVGAVLGTIGAPVAIAVAAIALIAIVIAAVVAATETDLDTFVQNFNTALSAIATMLGQLGYSLVASIGEMIIQICKAIIDYIDPVVNYLTLVIIEIVEALANAIIAASPAIMNAINMVLEAAADLIIDLVVDLWNILVDLMGAKFPAIADLLTIDPTSLDEVKDGVHEIFDTYEEAADESKRELQGLSDEVGEVGDDSTSLGEKLAGGLGSALSGFDLTGSLGLDTDFFSAGLLNGSDYLSGWNSGTSEDNGTTQSQAIYEEWWNSVKPQWHVDTETWTFNGVAYDSWAECKQAMLDHGGSAAEWAKGSSAVWTAWNAGGVRPEWSVEAGAYVGANGEIIDSSSDWNNYVDKYVDSDYAYIFHEDKEWHIDAGKKVYDVETEIETKVETEEPEYDYEAIEEATGINLADLMSAGFTEDSDGAMVRTLSAETTLEPSVTADSTAFGITDVTDDAEAAASMMANLEATYGEGAVGAAAAMEETVGEYEEVGAELGKAAANGAKAGTSSMTSTARLAASKAVSGFKSQYSQFYSSGSYTAQGWIRGIQSQYYQLQQAGITAANKVNDAYNKTVNLGSPAKVMIESGMYTGMGWVVGIQSQYAALAESGSTAATTVASAFSTAMAIAQDDDPNTWSPKITPVIDTSSIQNAGRTINSQFGNATAMNAQYTANIRGGTISTNALIANGFSALGGSVSEMALSNSGITSKFDELGDKISNMSIYLDGNTLVGKTASRMDTEMARNYIRKRRGV